MTTQQTDWIEYTGSDEQIAEIKNAKHGYVLKSNAGTEKMHTEIFTSDIVDYLDATSYYWIIPADPLRQMKIRQSMTGQPVWVRVPTIAERLDTGARTDLYYSYDCTCNPIWNIPNAEYSFTPWED